MTVKMQMMIITQRSAVKENVYPSINQSINLSVIQFVNCAVIHQWKWRVRGPCTPSAYCGLMVWRRQLCSRRSVRLSLSLLTPLRRGDAAPAWWVFTTSVDRQRIDAVLRRAVRSDLWTLSGKSDAHTFENLCNSADDELFSKIKTSSNHILHTLLPPPSIASQNYGLGTARTLFPVTRTLNSSLWLYKKKCDASPCLLWRVRCL